MKQTWRLLAALAVAGTFMVVTMLPASAAPYYYGDYGRFAGENAYPSGNHACGLDGWSQPVPAVKGTYGGRTYTIRLCYKNGVGAYGRLDGAAVNDTHCSAFIVRGDTAGQKVAAGGVGETVDSNVNYAYTKVVNDLSGRLAQAAIWCNGLSYGTTAWY